MRLLTLDALFRQPEQATFQVEFEHGEHVLVRPLMPPDVDALAAFLAGLSSTTRRYSTFASYDRAMAQELCDAINRYDKLRLVVELPRDQAMIGLLEFSFDIPDGDVRRYALHGVPLDARHDCRFGPTLADAYQNQGLGSRLFPAVLDVARRFGKQRIVLWGGVLADNRRAMRFYEKQNFEAVGIFEGRDGQLSIDMILDFGDRSNPSRATS